MRPYWKGYLKLALVSCPIALHAACSTAERIAFRQINKATGNRLRQQGAAPRKGAVPTRKRA
jgi:DNA end-binding protein Ku